MAQNSGQGQKGDNGKDVAPETQSDLSKLSYARKKGMFIVLAVAAFIGYIALHFILQIKGSGNAVNADKVVRPTEPEEMQVAGPSQLPSVPKLREIEVKDVPQPPVPAAPPPQEPVPIPNNVTDVLPSRMIAQVISPGSLDDQKAARRKTPIIVVGGAGTSPADQQKKEAIDPNQPKQAEFVKRIDQTLLLNRGKIIDAVLTTAINSDTKGVVVGTVTRDVFSADGRNVLIPKGSKLKGAASFATINNHGRVMIEWSTIELATGYVLNFKGFAIDNLGRDGIEGKLDKRSLEKLSNVLVSSALNIGFAVGMDKIIESQTSSADPEVLATIQSIRSGSMDIYADRSLPADRKANAICDYVKSKITDKASATYIRVVTECTLIANTATLTPDQKLTQAMNLVNSVADGMTQEQANAARSTNLSAATQDSYKSFTDSVKSSLTDKEIVPTITVDQGHNLKIYVDQDYLFPSDAVSTYRLVQ